MPWSEEVTFNRAHRVDVPRAGTSTSHSTAEDATRAAGPSYPAPPRTQARRQPGVAGAFLLSHEEPPQHL